MAAETGHAASTVCLHLFYLFPPFVYMFSPAECTQSTSSHWSCLKTCPMAVHWDDVRSEVAIWQHSGPLARPRQQVALQLESRNSWRAAERTTNWAAFPSSFRLRTRTLAQTEPPNTESGRQASSGQTSSLQQVAEPVAGETS